MAFTICTRSVVPLKRSLRQFQAEPKPGESLLLLLAAAFAVRIGEIKARTRRRAPAAFARQAAMYLAHVGLGLSYSEVGSLLRRDRTTVAHACQLVEDRRDDPLIDGIFGALEAVCYRQRRRLRACERGIS